MSAYSIGRALAILSLIWAAHHLFLALAVQDSMVSLLIIGGALAWGTVASLLWLGRGIVPVSAVTVVLCAGDLLILRLWADYAVILMAWLALALLAAPRQQRDQFLTARILLSTVYAFAALSKLQPSWLMGDNLHKLAASRPQAAWLEPFLVQPWLSLAAVAIVVTELWLAIGLWLPKTRLLTAVLGIMLHLVLTILAALDGMTGLLHLVALNGGLVLLYPAFWQQLEPGQGSR